MKRAFLCWGAVLILSVSWSCRTDAADAFVFEVAVPKFKIRIPGIPQIRMELHPLNASQPHLRFLGSAEPYTVAVFTPVAAAGMTPLECASAITRVMAARPDMPPASEVFKTRLNDATFVAIYAAPLGGAVQLHAHLLSAAGGTHCIEVHATKVALLEDDLASWVNELEKASIEPN
ncbi:MAG: hypothetical protein EXR30_04085 [Betaproteobacteria bacterium]|nr:hypothetical protein [Betaproteobacteria bacterium]